MKSFVRWSTTLSIIGTAVLGSCLIGNLQALALPKEQILQKLQDVPVFTITDSQGSPLVASVNTGDNKKGTVAGVFISKQDAQAFVDRLKKDQPDLAKNVRVVPVSLAEVYQLEEANKNKPDHLDFAYVPVQKQVESAVTLLRQSGQQVQQFNGTPLFVARAGKEGGYLTIQQGNQQMIPFFFDKEQLQGMVDRYKQQQPAQASTVQIQAVTLEGVLQTLKTSDNKQLNNIMLIPSQESIEFLRSLSPQNPSQNQNQQPQKK